MKVDSIRNGIVIDHINAGRAMEIYKLLGLDSLDCSVALIKNVPSRRMVRKDIIKIDSDFDLDINALGFVDPEVTVNIIRDGVVAEKKRVQLPKELVNVVFCKNPRCITSIEQELPQILTMFSVLPTAARAYTAAYTAKPAQGIKYLSYE